MSKAQKGNKENKKPKADKIGLRVCRHTRRRKAWKPGQQPARKKALTQWPLGQEGDETLAMTGIEELGPSKEPWDHARLLTRGTDNAPGALRIKRTRSASERSGCWRVSKHDPVPCRHSGGCLWLARHPRRADA
jgi:hypothetical protein